MGWLSPDYMHEINCKTRFLTINATGILDWQHRHSSRATITHKWVRRNLDATDGTAKDSWIAVETGACLDSAAANLRHAVKVCAAHSSALVPVCTLSVAAADDQHSIVRSLSLIHISLHSFSVVRFFSVLSPIS